MAPCMQKSSSGEQGRVLGRHPVRDREVRVCCRDERRVWCHSGKKQVLTFILEHRNHARTLRG